MVAQTFALEAEPLGLHPSENLSNPKVQNYLLQQLHANTRAAESRFFLDLLSIMSRLRNVIVEGFSLARAEQLKSSSGDVVMELHSQELRHL